MSWLANGNAACDTCGSERICVEDRHLAIQMMRVSGWRHMIGKTLGGQEFETILCRGCVHDEKRHSRKKREPDQDALPLDWEKGRRIERKQGS